MQSELPRVIPPTLRWSKLANYVSEEFRLVFICQSHMWKYQSTCEYKNNNTILWHLSMNFEHVRAYKLQIRFGRFHFVFISVIVVKVPTFLDKRIKNINNPAECVCVLLFFCFGFGFFCGCCCLFWGGWGGGGRVDHAYIHTYIALLGSTIRLRCETL